MIQQHVKNMHHLQIPHAISMVLAWELPQRHISRDAHTPAEPLWAAARYDKIAANFLGFVKLASIMCWLK